MTDWRFDRPYDEPPGPPDAERRETRKVLKAAIGANTALGQLDQAVVSIPNPTVLINSLPVLEAHASSEIENIVTTTDELFRHLGDDASADPATRETLRYRTAGGRRTGEPSGRDVLMEKLTAWESFIHAKNGLDPLVRMAAAHYQFEAIHPFSDGHGREGRIINVLMLVDAGLLRLPVLYLSRFIIDTKTDYYRLLLDVRAESAWGQGLLAANGMLQNVKTGATRPCKRFGHVLTTSKEAARKLVLRCDISTSASAGRQSGPSASAPRSSSSDPSFIHRQ